MKKTILFAATALTFNSLPLLAEPAEKLADDPTKVITKAGIRYDGNASINGSLALGPVSKINVNISETEEWSIGGSYLFKFGIINATGSLKKFPNGASQNQYTIGSFVPLSALGIKPANWQLFPAFGYSYSEGNFAVYDTDIHDFIFVPTSANSAYLGMLGLKPFNEKWTFLGGIVGAKGSNSYSGYSIGAGVTYKLTSKDSLSVFGSYIDNSFGTREVSGISYKHEF